MAYPIEGTLNGGVLNAYGNTVCQNQIKTIVITNTPWANQYTFSVVSGSNVYLYQSGNLCDFYTTSTNPFTIRVTVKNAKNCFKTRDINFSVSCSSFLSQVAPNPASSRLSVSIESFKEDSNISARLANLEGTQFLLNQFSLIETKLEFDVSNIPEGFYVLEISSDVKLLKEKVIIKR